MSGLRRMKVKKALAKMTDEELEDKTFWIFRYLMEDKNIRKLMLVDA